MTGQATRNTILEAEFTRMQVVVHYCSILFFLTRVVDSILPLIYHLLCDQALAVAPESHVVKD